MSAAFSYAWDAEIAARFGQGNYAMDRIRTLHAIHQLSNGTLTTNDYSGGVGLGWFKGIKVF